MRLEDLLRWRSTRQTDEIVCPHCLHPFEDSTSYGTGEDIGELQCGECDAVFYARRHLTVSYTTETLDARRGRRA